MSRVRVLPELLFSSSAGRAFRGASLLPKLTPLARHLARSAEPKPFAYLGFTSSMLVADARQLLRTASLAHPLFGAIVQRFRTLACQIRNEGSTPSGTATLLYLCGPKRFLYRLLRDGLRVRVPPNTPLFSHGVGSSTAEQSGISPLAHIFYSPRGFSF